MNTNVSNNKHKFLMGGGEMGEMIRQKDWSSTPLGSPDQWPQSLCTMVSVMLDNPFAMYIAWGKEYIQFYNDGYRPILGQNKHPEALGISTRDTFSEIWFIIGSMFDGVMAGKAVGFPDFMLPLNRNGFIEECYFDFSYSPIRQENGEIGGVLVTVIETTNKKRVQEQLKESTNQLQFAIEAAALGTWDYDPFTDKFTANHRLRTWFGLPETGEIKLQQAINVIAEKDRERITKAIQTALKYSSGGTYDEECCIINPITNKEIIVHNKGRAWFNNEKLAYRFTGTMQDVTEKVLIRRKIEESEERFRLMAESADILIATGDETGGATYFNNAWVQFTGRPMKDLLALGWLDLLHAEDKENFYAIFLKAFKNKSDFTGEFRMLDKNGNYSWLLAKGSARFTQDGTFLGHISSCINITEHKEREEALKQNKLRFEAAINAMEGVLWTNSTDGQMLGKQIGWEELTGQSYEQYQGYGWANAIHPDDAKPTIDAWNLAVAERKPFVFEHRVLTRTGDWRNFSVRAIPLISDKGLVMEWVGVHTDITEQQTSRLLIEESEQRFSNIANTAPVLIWMSGIDKLYYFFNTAWLAFTGNTIEKEVGNGWAEGVHPEDLERCLEIYVANFDKREAFYMEYRLKRHDGEYRWISNKGVPRFNTNGEFEGYIGACMDIHDQIANQIKIEEAEQRLRFATEVTGLATWELDLITKKIIYSPRLAEIFGQNRFATFSHQQMRQQIHPDDLHEVVEKAFDKAMAKGTYQYEARIIKPDNTICWISTKGRIFYKKDKTPLKMIGTLRDITEEKDRQQAIEASEKKFRLLADSMPQLIWTGSADGNLNYYNKAIYTFSGLTQQQLEIDGWIQIVHPNDREANIKAWLHAVATGEDFLFEHRFRRHDGEYRWQLSRAIAQRDIDGNIQMWVGSSTDIQDQKIFTNQLEQQVHERTKQLEEKNMALEKMNSELQSFAYVSSHDLQEPLRKIQTFIRMIVDKEGGNLTNKATDYFNRIQAAANRMQTLIQDLLAYSRTNTANKDFVKMDLTEIVNEVKEDFKDQLEENKYTLTIGKMCTATIIPFQFRQILYNLIGNAIKFAKKKEPLHINIYSEPVVNNDMVKDIPLVSNTVYCHIVISDNGIGFEPTYKDKIFEIFQRLHTKEEYVGTGIGLAIVKKITDNHNGFITATSQLGQGATFDIYLPL